MARIEYASPDFAGLSNYVRAHLLDDGVVVIRGFPVEPAEELIRFGQTLGTVVDNAVTLPGAAKIQVHEVRALDQPLLDSYGHAVVSTTDDEFRCHTDDFFLPEPSDVVLLLCVRQATVGGETIVASLAAVMQLLSDQAIAALSQPSYPTPFGATAVLSRRQGPHPADRRHRGYAKGEVQGGRGAGWQIRYNPLELEKALQAAATGLPERAAQALVELEDAIAACATVFKLDPGDCLVLDNAVTLHGRTAYSAGGDRLLRRAKVNL